MGKIKTPAIIRGEDFPEETRETVDKLAAVLNPFNDDVFRQMNGNLGFDNINRQLVTLDVKIDSSGEVINEPQIKISLRTKVAGTNVISAQNLVNTSTYPTSQPFISWSTNGNILTIKNITGLQANSQYRLTVELIGN
jgi:hypothetical protein